MYSFSQSDLKKFYKELENWEPQSVATAAEIHVSTIYYWLSGKTKTPRPVNVMSVANVIGYKIKPLRQKSR